MQIVLDKRQGPSAGLGKCGKQSPQNEKIKPIPKQGKRDERGAKDVGARCVGGPAQGVLGI